VSPSDTPARERGFGQELSDEGHLGGLWVGPLRAR
jgi:hypothetical protein